MLVLNDVTKTYASSDFSVQALKGVSLAFRKNEFVAILGQSGCGKTTLLNIIGGLDRYTTGDMLIEGVSTKKYKDRDWDTYRNHTVGFVFQSYNLIPHQTVLGNVELALTLSGVSLKERRERAAKALEKVGLGEHLKKRPNQLSGGQMQRVAIARALVNDPAVILADEPTGALDTETSVQVMDLLKEVAKDRLVIMVTHNPDLAKEYATRIITLSDGLVTGDSHPCSADELQLVQSEEERLQSPVEQKLPKEESVEVVKKPVKEKNAKKKKAKMSFFTALRLSLRNLSTKKTRTALVSFAGSIGIIGIALILSLSSGFQNYIDNVQRDTLSNYPLEITSSTVDFASMMSAMSTPPASKEKYPDSETVTVNEGLKNITNLAVSSVKTNDLKSLKTYLEANVDFSKVSAIQYQYGLQLRYLKKDKTTGAYSEMEDPLMKLIPSSVTGGSSSMLSSFLPSVFSEMLDNQELLQKQYDLLDGDWANPNAADEVMIVVDQYNQISDYTLYYLGLMDLAPLLYDSYMFALQMQYPGQEIPDSIKEEILNMVEKETGTAFDPTAPRPEAPTFTFRQLLEEEFTVMQGYDFYHKENGVWVENPNALDSQNVASKSTTLKIKGILRLKEGVASGSITGAIGYNKALTKKMLSAQSNSQIISEQKANSSVSVFTGEACTPQDYAENLTTLGVASEDTPSAIYIYPTTFENKDYVKGLINTYNEGKEEEDQIIYSDLVDSLMGSVTIIIDVISYVLIAFVSISLIVSSIMIGIITYISVLERTKEIGVLRSLGASKRDISNVFNAETLIVGFLSGILGIAVTLLLNIPINLIINHFAEIGTVASLPVGGAIILVGISMFLTFIAGLIPSKIAAKKDPVVALRTE
ncbi:MAG: ABC transporter ATP-binding protein/permease [Clostridiales bacterium]|nr:ABC transporter ATP-binding protein/permease [Clostridiales bacterium]